MLTDNRQNDGRTDGQRTAAQIHNASAAYCWQRSHNKKTPKRKPLPFTLSFLSFFLAETFLHEVRFYKASIIWIESSVKYLRYKSGKLQ